MTTLGWLKLDPGHPLPIWAQIEEAVRRAVASGQLTSGSPMPSVRELARDVVVNPATVAKAYQHLCGAGVLVVRRGEGTYVADAPPAMSRGERGKVLKEAAVRYATVARTIGASADEALDETRQALGRLARGTTSGEPNRRAGGDR